MHLALFLSQSLAATPTLLSSHLTQPAMDRYLETKQLGASVGRAWELESIMRWREVRGLDGEPSGLYKTRGAVLEAIVGGVYLRHVRPHFLSLAALTWRTGHQLHVTTIQELGAASSQSAKSAERGSRRSGDCCSR